MRIWNFQRRQFITLVTLVMIPLVAIFLMAGPIAEREIRQRTLVQVETVAEALDQQIHNWFDDGTHVARELSTNETIRQDLRQYQESQSPEDREIAINNLRDTIGIMGRVHNAVWAIDLLDPETGDVMVSTLFAEESKNYTQSDCFQSMHQKDSEHFGYFTNADSPVLCITTPIKTDGTLLAIGLVKMNLSNLEDVLHLGISLMPTERAYLVNDNGDYLTSPKYKYIGNLDDFAQTMGGKQVAKGENGTEVYENIDGASVLGVYRWMPVENIGLVVELNEDSYNSQTAVIKQWLLIIAIVMTILTIIAARVLNHWLTAPLISLSQAAQEFQTENFAFRLHNFRDDEFGHVAQAFNQMAESLQESHAGLSKKVVQSSAELVDSNVRLRQEIENRISIEKDLKRSEEKFRTAFFTSPDGVSISRISDGLYVDVNDSFIQALGYTYEEVIGKTSLDINLWTDAYDRVKLARELEEKGYVENFDVQVKRKDTSVFPVLISAKIIMIDNVPHLLAITRDITLLKEAQRELQLSEIHYRDIFEGSPISLWEESLADVKIYLEELQASGVNNIPKYLHENMDAVVHCGSQLQVLDINRETLRLFRAKTKEDIIANLDTLFLEDSFNTVRDILIAFWRGETEFETDGKWQTINGVEFYGRMKISISPSHIETWDKVFLSIVDITPQVRARQSLNRRNQELSVLNHIIAASMILQNPTSILELSCRELGNFFEVSAAVAFLMDEYRSKISVVAEYRTEDNDNVLLGQSLAIDKNPIVQYLANHQAPMLIENVATDKRLNKMAVWLLERDIVSLIISPLIVDNIIVGAIVVADKVPRKFGTQDLNLVWGVTDQLSGVISRMKLTQQNQRLVAAVEQIAESIIITDIDTNIIYVNPAFEKITQYKYKEVIGKKIFDLYTEEVSELELEERHVLLLQGKTWQGHIEGHTKTNERIIEEEIINALRNEQGKISGFIFVRRDVTRETQLEEQYHQAQKMEAIGRLTGGISHDFNNILTAINGFAELMLRRSTTDEWQHRMAQNILGLGQKAADLVRQLLIFSRKKPDKTQVINLNDVVFGMEKILSRVIGEYVEIDTQMGENLWNIEGDTTQFEQVILNLSVNARDAIIENGHLTLKTENIVVEPEYIRAQIEIPPGNYVLLTVSDDGMGMSDETKAHIFEPFFTTKESHRGTGLGLATVYGIIQQSAGFISVDSTVGQGTNFRIYIPAVNTDVSVVTTDTIADSPQILTGHETILLAEDEEAVREMSKRFLEQYGYTVLEAIDGMDALQVVGNYSQEIHLLLTDVVMPKLNGVAMSKQFSETHPHTPILYISGYMDDILREHGMSAEEINFLAKPFSPDELLKKVRNILDERNGD